MNIKKILALALAAMLILSLTACAAPANNGGETATTSATTANNGETATTGATTANNGETATGKNTITVKVVHKDGSEKVFTYQTDEEFLGDVLLSAELIKGNNGAYGLEITEVDGETAIYANDKAYWALYEGDQYALQGISTTPIKDGGEYALVYTKG